MVGRIVNHDVSHFQKGQEKGHFRLGGSTIVVLAKKDSVLLDEDILSHLDRGMEVKLRYHEKIGVSGL